MGPIPPLTRLAALAAALTAALAAGALPSLAADAPAVKARGARVEFTKELREQTLIELEVEDADHKEMVQPAPKGFNPESDARKLRLMLVARDKSIRVGERFWYRIELQNVGRERVRFHDSPSFLKDGRRYDSGKWLFDATLPDGTTKAIVLGRMFDEFAMEDRRRRPIKVEGAENMSDDEVRQFVWRDGIRRSAERDLALWLNPGEILASRPWRWVGIKEYDARLERGEKELFPRPEGTFRELWTQFEFEVPGRYEVRLEFHDGPSGPLDKDKPLSEKDKEYYRRLNRNRVGILQSNPVTILVLP